MDDKIERMIMTIIEPGYAVIDDKDARALYIELCATMANRISEDCHTPRALGECLDEGKALGDLLMAKFIVENWDKLEDKDGS